MFFQALVAPVMFAGFCVLPAIRLDRDSQHRTREIQHERRDRMLPSEVPAERVATQS